jgi:hypothetical protein
MLEAPTTWIPSAMASRISRGQIDGVLWKKPSIRMTVFMPEGIIR